MAAIDLVVMDMAGTTVTDRHEVEACFVTAAKRTGLIVSDERVLAMQGLSKRYVFETLWTEQLSEGHADIPARVDVSYDMFREVLENHYQTHEVTPTDGCLDTLHYLREQNIPIALTTGFYRLVTDIILGKLGWLDGLDMDPRGGRLSTRPDALIRASVASDEVGRGRPFPELIERAMLLTGVTDPRRVVNLGDTPSDLLSARSAGCGLDIGLVNGTHSRAQLEVHPHDMLLDSLGALPDFLLHHHFIQSEGAGLAGQIR